MCGNCRVGSIANGTKFNYSDQLLLGLWLDLPQELMPEVRLQSGLSGGVFHQLTPFQVINWAARRDVCLGSLSWCWSGYTAVMKGISVWSRTET